MKKSYKQPKVQVIEFECEDVITTSSFSSDAGTGGSSDPGELPPVTYS